MAQSYLRTIEFKVKDTGLKNAVERLQKSLVSVDKNVEKINKNFTGLSKALKGVATEFNQIAKSSEKLAKNSSKQKSPLDPKKLTQSAKGLVKIKQLLKDLKNTSSLLDGDGRKTKEFNDQTKAFSDYIKKIAEGSKALADNEAVLKRQIAALATAANNAKIGGDLYVRSIQGQTRAEQKLRLAQLDRIRAQKELYASGTGKGFQNNQALLAMKPDNNIASLSIYRAELEQALSLVDLSGEEYQKIEAAIDGINERLNASSRLKKEQLKTEQDLSKAEAKRLKNQETFLSIANRSLSRAKFDTQAAINVGKAFGKLPNLAKIGIGVKGLRDMDKWLKKISPMFLDVDKRVGKLAQRIPVIGKVLNENLSTNVRWSANFIEGITSVNLAWSGLMQTIQAAQAFVSFERQAAIALNNVARHIKQVWGVAGAMMMGFISPGQVGKNVLDSLNDRPEVMAARRGPSGIERLEMQQAKKQAEFKNTELREYSRMELIARQLLEIETGITEETRERIMMMKIQQDLMKKGPVWTQYDSPAGPGAAGAGWGSNMDDKLGGIKLKLAEEITASTLENSGAVRKLLQEEVKVNSELKKRDQILKTLRQGVENVNLSVEDQRNMFGTSNAESLAAQRERETTEFRGRTVSRRGFRAYHAKMKRRRERRQRLNEGLMLGAGFPVLFGGGIGSVLGGTLGATAQAKAGPESGFGAQILLSAVGQAVDAFVVKTAEVGKALGGFTKDTGALTEAMGLAGTAEGQRIKIIEQLQGEQAAFDAMLKQLTGTIGETGVQRLKDFGDKWREVSMGMQSGMLRLQSALAGVLLAIDKIFKVSEGAREDRIRTFAATSDDKTLVDLRNRLKAVNERTGGGRSGAKNRSDSKKAIQKEILEKATPLFDKQLAQTAIDNVLVGEKERIKLRKEEIQIAELAQKYQKTYSDDLAKEIAKEEIKFNKVTKSLEALKEETTLKKDSLKDTEANAAKIAELVVLETQLETILKNRPQDLEAIKDSIEGLFESTKDSTEELNAAFKEVGVAIRDGLVEGINAAIDGTKTLGEIASNTFKRISNALLNYGVNLALAGLPGGLGSFFGSALGVKGKAAGGPVKGNSPYIVGEKGPELFVPNSHGNIVPNHEMGGANIVVNVDASGSAVEGDEGQGAELGRMLGAAIQAELIKEKRPGGLLAGR